MLKCFSRFRDDKKWHLGEIAPLNLRRIMLKLAGVLVALATVLDGQVGAQSDKSEIKFVLARVKTRSQLRESNLSPHLIAVRDGNGSMAGYDEEGNPVIRLLKSNLDDLEKSDAVIEPLRSLPEVWTHFQMPYQFTLGYHEKLTEEELSQLDLLVVEDYQTCQFMTVELKKGLRIDATLMKKLEQNKKIRYCRPNMILKAEAVKSSHE
jgi:hypothetical protein